MSRELPVTVTQHESPSKKIPDHNAPCLAMLCCPQGWCLFSLGCRLLQRGHWCQDGRAVWTFQFILHHLYPSGGFPHSLQSLHMQHVPGLTQLQPIQCKQTICPLFIQIYPNIIWCLASLPDEQGANRCSRSGGRVTAGYKNAYSSLWLVQELAAGGLGLGLGQGPGPELAQLLAAMLSLPQPQPHCAKLLHTYNLLIIRKSFWRSKKKKKRKHILQSERVGGKLTQTELPFSRK